MADDASAAARDDWLALVRRTVKDKDVASLTRRATDGLSIAPLYTDEDSPPAARLRFDPRDAERPWDLRAATAHPSPDAANAEILTDLDGGAASILVRIDPSGQNGVAVGSAEALARTLDGVILELAPVGVDAGFLGVQAADWLADAGKSSPTAQLMFHLDPLSAFAAAGRSPGPIEAHLIAGANAGARLSATYPKASLFLASGQVVHEAGGGAADELGFMAASALAYAKALVRAGMSLDEAFARITLGLAADLQHFRTIAKLRAARIIWERIVQACGVEAAARIEARSSRRMLATQDVWTNMLRLTIAGFAAASGGADAVVLGAFTDPLGLPTAFARRQSRNAQLVLMEEAHVGAVADPGRGAWFIESLTDQIARAGWASFQAIEAAGGVARALEAGSVARERGADSAQVGVTVFPNPNDTPPTVEAINPKDFAVDAPSPRLPGPDSICPAVAP
ncbi:MAG TPA: methylmalonyl-CoA mutase family protein [Caulobacteraceae bacterium]|jgi:methylmalonyl-CoA mutase